MHTSTQQTPLIQAHLNPTLIWISYIQIFIWNCINLYSVTKINLISFPHYSWEINETSKQTNNVKVSEKKLLDPSLYSDLLQSEWGLFWVKTCPPSKFCWNLQFLSYPADGPANKQTRVRTEPGCVSGRPVTQWVWTFVFSCLWNSLSWWVGSKTTSWIQQLFFKQNFLSP